MYLVSNLLIVHKSSINGFMGHVTLENVMCAGILGLEYRNEIF